MKKILLFSILIVGFGSSVKPCSNAYLHYTAISCAGACDGTVTYGVTGAFHYVLNNGDTVWSDGNTAAYIQNLCAGGYSISAYNSQDSFLCQNNFVLYTPEVVNATDSVVNAPCQVSHGSVFIAANMSCSYTWGNGITDYGNSQNSSYQEIEDTLSPGFYSVTVTQYGCPTDSMILYFTIDSSAGPLVVTDSIVPIFCNRLGGFILNITNGDGNYTYSYGPNYGTTNPSWYNIPVQAGFYPMTIYEKLCPYDSVNINVTVPYEDTSVIIFADTISEPTVCNPCNGIIKINAIGGSPPYIYYQNGAEITNTLSSLCAGSYIVQAIDVNGCPAWDTITMINNDSISLDISNTNISCPSGIDTTILSLSYGSSPFAINWGDGFIDSAFTPSQLHIYLQSGHFSIQITDQKGCAFVLNDTILYSGIQLNVVDTINPVCNALNIGTIKVSANGGTPPYHYFWNNGATSDSITNLTAGNYAVTVTDTTGCHAYMVYRLNQLAAEPGYSVYIITGNVNCAINNGSAIAQVSGGISPFHYTWNTNPVQTTDTAVDLRPGVYNLTVTDSIGCQIVGSTSVYEGCSNIISGYIFNDPNGNCILDSGEVIMPDVYLTASGNGNTYFGTTLPNGGYTIEVPDSGSFNLSCSNRDASCGGHFVLCNQLSNITFAGIGDSTLNYNFAFEGSTGFDLSLHPGWTSGQPGSQKEYWTYYFNQSPVPYTGSATIIFTFDSNLIYQYSTTPIPAYNATAHSLTWIVDSFPVNNWVGRLNNFFLVPTTLSLNYLLQTSWSITPTVGDCDTANNFFNFIEPIVGSHDPNEKEVSPKGGIVESDSVLTYTINFQNTGTAATNFIIVKDTLSPYLDPATVVNLASSAKYSDFSISGPGILTWTFNSLSLPDSLTSVNGSKGFIIFSVKKKNNLPAGTAISNTASIYFDYNAAVVTNTVSDTLVIPTFAFEAGGNGDISVKAFPNPFSDVTNIVVSGVNQKFGFELYDIAGRPQQSLPLVNSNQFTIHRDGFAPGVYLYRIVVCNQPIAFGKLIVE